MTIDSRFVRKRRTSQNKMRHSQLEGQRHLEAGGENESEEMSEGISPAPRRSLRDEGCSKNNDSRFLTSRFLTPFLGNRDDKKPRTTSAAGCDKNVDSTSNLEPRGR